ncbi:MMPL family transporter [Phytoactinopolyspora mesophila]|uniref:MMPL family transporter n=1 Tax=Phytoactinopolyspora mesophila TaxID=2650750 RepID=A0A7K3M9S1_9ACTN|nr:MMPL family transporter [Phytoactinopolyspora mesophila]NDL60033.1 MMPL family transporter [Phytoactinopolyspora mesophila]
MATLLYRLGRLCFRRRKLVLVLWIGALVVVGVGGATLAGDRADRFEIPGTEAQEAIDLLEQRFPEAAAGGASARVVFAASSGEVLTDPGNAETIRRVVDVLGDGPQVAGVSDPIATGALSPDATIGYAEIHYAVSEDELTDAARDTLAHAAEVGRDAGVIVEMGGSAVESDEEVGHTEIIGLAVAAMVLIVTLGSLLAAGLPLVNAILGVAVGLSAIAVVSRFVDLGTDTPMLAMMLGLAVGIDYSLFIVVRYRHELASTNNRALAAGRAIGTAGSAVVFAGLTVVVALVALTVLGLPVLTEIGLAAAGTVTIAVLVALTLLPAWFGFAGERLTSTRNVRRMLLRRPAPVTPRRRLGERWATFVIGRPVAVLTVAVLGLGVVAIPTLDLRLGWPHDGYAAEGSTQRQAYDLISTGFGAGFNAPLTVVVDGSGSTDPERAVDHAADAIARLPNTESVSPPAFNEAGYTALLEVIPGTDADDEATEDLVHAIRETGAELSEETGAKILVTGQTALDIDSSAKMADALLPYLALAVGLSLILLMIVFRSVLVPIKAAAGYLLTIAATFGAVVAVFQWGWLANLLGLDTTGPIINLMPVVLVGLTFGLAIDYEVFLVSRIREEHVRGRAPASAIVAGFDHSARVVTAAALIMISVFFGFVLSDNPLIKLFGFTLGVGILIDAFVVRMTIVPAVMRLLGNAAWWLPPWLDRILPNVDVEGAGLRANADGTPPVDTVLSKAESTRR